MTSSQCYFCLCKGVAMCEVNGSDGSSSMCMAPFWNTFWRAAGLTASSEFCSTSCLSSYNGLIQTRADSAVFVPRISTCVHAGTDCVSVSGIESRWGREFPHPFRPAVERTQPPVRVGPGHIPSGRGAGAWC